ncbi:MAG: hypothetical protein J5798_02500 [Spirochaetaceae bacterium]|nr:hypothetical protein [Spirochaetaceae bacterium]
MKRIIGIIITFCFLIAGTFAQSAKYSKYLSEAKKYEEKKQWAFALDAYYDALGCGDESSLKIDALNGYIALSEAIKSGNPGLGKYNPFAMHDEWKKLLIDAEKLGSTICKFELHLGKLEQADLNYETRTASYKSKVQYEISDRYKKTIGVVEEGYKAAYKTDWTDLPKINGWPLYSVSSAKNAVYDVGGAKILEVPSRLKNKSSDYYNAFAVFCWEPYKTSPTDIYYDFKTYAAGGMHSPSRTLYDYKFNIVDQNGKELVKGKRWLLSCGETIASDIILEGINPEIMDLIDNEKAFINPIAIYLEYGKYNHDDDKKGRTFIKNFPESQMDISKAVIYCWNKPEDLNALHFNETFNENIIVPLVKSYFGKLSARGKFVNDSNETKFEIPLDDAYTYESGKGMILNLKDDAGRVWKISEEIFLTTVRKISNQEYSIKPYSSHPYYLQRNVTDTEKTEYKNYNTIAQTEAVKLYYEKISVKGRINEHMGYKLFEIPLDKSYDYQYFTLQDSSGKVWKISREEFLVILKKIINQEYRINGTRLSRNLTEEEMNQHKSAWNDAVKLYFEKISKNGKINREKDTFSIPLDSSFSVGSFNLKDSSGESWKIKENDFLRILKEITNQDYSIDHSTDILYRKLTDEEKEKEMNLRKSAWNDAVKLYFEKISKNCKIDAEKNTFSISLDSSFSVGSFYLEDSSGKNWKIKETDFLEILKEITNQDYSINQSTDTLYRNLTDEEKKEAMNLRNSALSEAVKLYFEKISKNGKINREKDTFSIPLDSSFIVGSFYLKDSSGNSWKIKENDFLRILKEITNQDYSIIHSTDTLYRKLTDEEKATYKSAKQKF